MKKVLFFIILAIVLFGLPLLAYTEDNYVGANRCRACHMTVYRSWHDTPHAQAFEALKPGQRQPEKENAGLSPEIDYTQDISCLACHTTGMAYQFEGVQCESCHGPGRQYTHASIMNRRTWGTDPEGHRQRACEAGLIIKTDEATCLQCHNDRSPTYRPFHFTEMYEKVKHPE